MQKCLYSVTEYANRRAHRIRLPQHPDRFSRRPRRRQCQVSGAVQNNIGILTDGAHALDGIDHVSRRALESADYVGDFGRRLTVNSWEADNRRHRLRVVICASSIATTADQLNYKLVTHVR